MKNVALAIAGFVVSVIGVIERCWLKSPGIVVLAVLVTFGITFDSHRNLAVLLGAALAYFVIMSRGRLLLRIVITLFLIDAIVDALRHATLLHPWTMAS
jgi:hypothetical protein